MQRYLLFIDDLSTWVGKAFSWCILILTFVTVYDVTARYVFTAPTGWAYDTEYIMYGTLFMMSGAYAVSRNAHVRGDFISRRLPFRVQAIIELVCYLLFFFPGMIALLYSGYDFFHMSWLDNEHSSSSPTGPPIWPFKGIIPVAAFFLLLQGIVEVIRCIIAIRTGKWPKRRHDVEELEKVILEEAAAGMTAKQILADVEGKAHNGGRHK
ncbi:MAG TPA: TRAP transporter small permease subunit [Burkholderiales bacterium]|nr:TRAP transporter small permease subunit [Burkholderiales bacterium]